MGAWGTGLYDDDTTCDVRDDYVKNLKKGMSDSEASKQILDQFGDLIKDLEVGCLVYFSLADTQWKYGRLDQKIKEHALALINQAGDMTCWEPSEEPARKKVLERLKKRLLSAQPERKAVKIVKPVPKVIRTTAPIGSLFLVALPSGQFGALVLVGFFDDEKYVDPVFSALDWRGDALSPEHLANIPAKTLKVDSGIGKVNHVGLLTLAKRSKKDNPMNCLVPTKIVVDKWLAYDPYSTTFTTAFAEEIEASLMNKKRSIFKAGGPWCSGDRHETK